MLNLRSLDPLIELAFEEDIGIGDITTEATVPSTRKGIGTFLAKSEGIVAGLPVAERVFEKLDSTLTFRTLVNDGDAVVVGTPIAEVQGSAKSILIGERTALNFLQRLSGIATLTTQFVEAVADYDTKIVDTRKTAAGWRAVQKYAVRVGGAQNHRFGLYDGVLIKDNHIVAAGGITNAVQRARQSFRTQQRLRSKSKPLNRLTKPWKQERTSYSLTTCPLVSWSVLFKRWKTEP